MVYDHRREIPPVGWVTSSVSALNPLQSVHMAHMPGSAWGSGPKSLRFRPIIVALP